ncbi:hypothetical protein KCU65_g2643, partial [Aureobasidium melanogenum]
MTDYITSSPISAGTFDIPSTPNVPSTPSVLSTPGIPSPPVVPSSPCLKDEPMTEDEESFPPTPEGLSRRQYNLFKRNRKATLKAARMMAQVMEEMTDATEDVATESDSPEGYQKGDFGRQARKLLKSNDKHGMLSPGTHRVVKPAVVRYYSYKKDFRVAQRLAERKSRKNGGIRMI